MLQPKYCWVCKGSFTNDVTKEGSEMAKNAVTSLKKLLKKAGVVENLKNIAEVIYEGYLMTYYLWCIT